MAYEAASDPTSANDETQGFRLNGEWRNTATQDMFLCTDASEGSAVWALVTDGDLLSPGTVTDDRLVVFDGVDGLQTKQGGKTATEVGAHLDSAAEHRTIDDGATGNTDLWSANQIILELESHSHGAELPAPHSPSHETGGGDELAVADIGGDTAGTPRPPTAHAHAHADATGQGTDDHHSEDHASRHESGGGDELSHDALADYAIGQHRVINDAGTSAIETWSASKIDALVSALESGMEVKPGADTSTHDLGNIALTGEQTLNGLLTSTSRVIVTEQTAPAENGIYDSAAGAWSRADDADEDAEVTNGDLIYVTNAGSTKVNCKYLLVTADPITVGVTGQDWEEACPIEFGTTGGTATEGDDSRVPSQDENDALAGTSGTPSSANKFVTNADSRNSDARAPTAHTVASHDTDATGAQLNTLVGGDDANGLHTHPPAQLFPWTFATSTAAADPGGGRMRMNNATPSLVTSLYFNQATGDGYEFDNFFANLVVGEEICAQQGDDSSKRIVLSISGAPTDNGGWWTVPVTFVSATGGLFGNNKSVFWLIKMRF